MGAAGLGLRLYDILFDGSTHSIYNDWWEYTKRVYIPFEDGNPPDSQTLYYDPVIDYHHVAPSASGSLLYFHTAAQHREDTAILFDNMIDRLGWSESVTISDGERGVSSLVRTAALAREFGKDLLYSNLILHADANYEPTWDSESGEFTWGFGLNEVYPRGQYNAIMAYAEAGSAGAWAKLFDRPNLEKFDQPTVHGVDFPNISLTQASYDSEKRRLVISTDDGIPSMRGEDTNFRVSHISLDTCSVTSNSDLDWKVVDGEIEITIKIAAQTILISH